MAAQFVYRFIDDGTYFWHRTRAQTRGDIIRGVNAFRTHARKTYKIDVRARHSNVEGVRISVRPIVRNGQHYTGMATKGQIYLHPLAPVWQKPLSAGVVVWHEFLHTRGIKHNGDARDLMNPNGGTQLTVSLAWFRRMFGVIKPKSLSMNESAEEVVALIGNRDGCPVGAFKVKG